MVSSASTSAFVVFPHQLFYMEVPRAAKSFQEVWIVEEPIFFFDSKFRPIKPNKVKLAYMVASMHAFHDHLKKKHPNVRYIPYDDVPKHLNPQSTFTCFHPYDMDLLKKYPKAQVLDQGGSPYFLMHKTQLDEFHAQQGRNKRMSHAAFYAFVKNKLDVLRKVKSQDVDNRKPLPESLVPDMIREQHNSDYYKVAKAYVEEHPVFKHHLGSVQHVTLYPITPKACIDSLHTFCKTRLKHFGPYQDAIHQGQPTLYHSVLSAAINVGILTPQQVLQVVMGYKTKVPINSLEGYVRQLIGWREWCGYLYMYHYEEMVKSNTFHAKRSLPKSWYTGTTGIKPLDSEIKQAIDYGYAHHIVRLMVFLNLMVLYEIQPNDIYMWFMEVVAIDAFDWVMRPNLQMMSYYWPRATHKPYISASAYILKMTNYKKETDWCAVWDALFYKFLFKHQRQLKGSAQVYLRNLAYFNKLPDAQKKSILNGARKVSK